MLCAALWLTPAMAIELTPKEPAECQPITLTVHRSFTADCAWRITPTVRHTARRIEVTLTLRGERACDQVMTDRTFDVPIGSFPAGEYRLSIRWSDSDHVETRPLTITPASAAAGC